MSREDEDRLSAERLAEEIRRGMREAAPHPSEDTGASPALRAWAGAERYAVPSVAAGATLAAVKRLLLRVLRIATRSQGTFNAKLLEGARSLDRTVEELRRDLADAKLRLTRQNDVLQARVAALERAGAASVTGAPTATPIAATPGITDGLYARFEDEFRGTFEDVRERQEQYVDFFQGAPGPVLDCGCGRGEFVALLRRSGIEAEGVETNRVAVTIAEREGLPVTAGDAFERLSRERGRLGGVAALQFVEHLEPGAVREFLGRAFEALAPGGRLLLETTNPDSLYAMRAYRLDPTHRWPVPAATLSLLARDAGFVEKEVRYLAPVPPEEALAETGENERKLNRWLFGFQDYALLAERPGA
jgi:O-antigen chain-terminating methyltransferase